MIAGVAAGHSATAAAGIEILAEGGTAADAAVAACLASCVAETVMTGLLGGGHAIYFDAATGAARNLDFFCAAPGLGEPRRKAELLHLDVQFGAELVHYAVGPASCAVPGVPAGLDALWRAHGRLPWERLVEPALRLAQHGVGLPPAHAACLEMVAPAYTLGAEGGRIYSRGGRLLRSGDMLQQPGIAHALGALATDGAADAYRGTIAESLLALARERDVLVTRDDLESYAAWWSEPAEVPYLGLRFVTRDGLSGVPSALRRLPRLRGLSPSDRAVALVAALDGGAGPETHTTNLVTVDAAGNTCVLTTSLGLGSGDYLPGLDLQLNSMLGEVDLLTRPLEPGERMQSMMAPSIAFDTDGPVLAIGSAGGTRLRTALVTVAAAILDEGLAPQDAVELPRVHPAGAVVNAEPGADEAALGRLAADGREVRRWPERHHYFGGASAIGRTGLAADPRRSGAALAASPAG